MRLLAIRHAIAEEREVSAENGKDDALRPLTKKGKRKMRKAAKGLRHVVPELDLIATSPLTRAVETGEIVSDAYGSVKTLRIAPLTPRKPVATLVEWLLSQPRDATVGVVGHEPHLGLFVSWMLTGMQESFVVLKKGGAFLLDLGDEPRAGRAKLVWAMTPSQLRDLAKCGGKSTKPPKNKKRAGKQQGDSDQPKRTGSK